MAEDMVGHPKPAVKREIISTCLLPGLTLANNRDIDLKSTVHVSVTFWSLIRLLEFKTHDFGNEKIAQGLRLRKFDAFPRFPHGFIAMQIAVFS